MKRCGWKPCGVVLTVVWLVLLALSGGGCANTNARRHCDYILQPHTYPATRYAARGRVVNNAMDAVGFQYSSGWLLPDNLLQGLLLESVFSVYSIAVELPASAVTDTIMLPYDRRRVRKFRDAKRIFHAILLGDDPLVDPILLSRHYVPVAFDAIIHEFVQQGDAVPDAREKLALLIDGGMGLELVAGSPLLDAAHVRLLLDRDDPWPEWTVDPMLGKYLRYRAGQKAGRSYGVPNYTRWCFADFLRVRLVSNRLLSAHLLIDVARSAEPHVADSVYTLLAMTDYPPDTFEALLRDAPSPLRARIAANQNVPPSLLTRFSEADGQDRKLELALASNPMTEREVLERLSESEALDIRLSLAANPALDATLLGRLARGAATTSAEITLATRIAGHLNTDLETLLFLIGIDHLDVGYAIVNRTDLLQYPPDLLDQLADGVVVNKRDGVRLGRAIVRWNHASAHTLDRLARVPGVRWDVARAAETRTATLDYLAEVATSDSDPDLGNAVAFHPKTSEAALRRLAESDNEIVNEALARNAATPPEVVCKLGRNALAMLARADRLYAYHAMGVVNNVVVHPNLSAESIDAFAVALDAVTEDRNRLDIWERLIDHPAMTPFAFSRLRACLDEMAQQRGLTRKKQNRIDALREKSQPKGRVSFSNK